MTIAHEYEFEVPPEGIVLGELCYSRCPRTNCHVWGDPRGWIDQKAARRIVKPGDVADVPMWIASAGNIVINGDHWIRIICLAPKEDDVDETFKWSPVKIPAVVKTLTKEFTYG